MSARAVLPESAIRIIGFVGLGNMGQPMSACLLRDGFTVQGFDLAPAARDELMAAGGQARMSSAEAVRGADLVILMLPGSDAVESVIDEDGFLGSLSPDAVIVDMSSSEPLRTRALAERLAAQGHTLLDAPVSGGVARARDGELTIMVGGAEKDVAFVTPVLKSMGNVTHAGPVGAGHAAKALNNLMSAVHLLASSEAVIAGQRFGIDPETLLAIVNTSSGRSWSTEYKWPRFVLTETYNSGFSLGLMVKDMRIATGLASSLHSPCVLGEKATELWARAAEALPPNADHTEVARWVRMLGEDQ